MGSKFFEAGAEFPGSAAILRAFEGVCRGVCHHRTAPECAEHAARLTAGLGDPGAWDRDCLSDREAGFIIAFLRGVSERARHLYLVYE